MKWIAVLAGTLLLTSCGGFPPQKGESMAPESGAVTMKAQQRPNQNTPFEPTGAVDFLEPLDGAVYPRDMAPPVFEWTTRTKGIQRWMIEIRLPDREPIHEFTRETSWQPGQALWETIRKEAGDAPVEVRLFGFGGAKSKILLDRARTRFTISRDAVDSSIMYRQLPLPYRQSEAYVRQITWRLGSVREAAPPRTVMKSQRVCSGCHQASADGTHLAMEMNVGGDGGAQWVKPVAETMIITDEDVMTWSDFPKPPFFPETRGSFAKLSPSGRYIASPVNEISLMVLTGEKAYSQLFFPTFGFLGVYDLQTKTFAPLPGAQDWDYVHTDPSWYPDESALLFARAETRNAYHPDPGNITTQTSEKNIFELNQRYPVQFDICRLPLDADNGATPLPLEGASNNGMSNALARVSPDGRWVVFTQSQSGLILQPDSALYIVPAHGGTARRMTCNRSNMNSWHSWSPNGRWLVFASKHRSMFTELYLTHVDENGMDAPAIRLSRFSHPTMAANIPEFVPFQPDAINRISL